jgi:hypothetical protein
MNGINGIMEIHEMGGEERRGGGDIWKKLTWTE